MSWFRKALSICVPEPGSYYTTIDPLDFYEWRFTQTIPKGSIFTSYLPPSDIFTEGKIIASAVLPQSTLKKSDSGGHETTCDVGADVVLKVGCMPSPEELLTKYSDTKKELETGLDRFKEGALTRRYLTSQTKKPHLCRIDAFDDNSVTLHNFGVVNDLVEKFMTLRQALIDDAMDKHGRAHEMEEFRRYDNAITFINNKDIYVDASKMDRLLHSSGVKSKISKTIPWKECYLEMSPGAQLLSARLKQFDSKKWVQATFN